MLIVGDVGLYRVSVAFGREEASVADDCVGSSDGDGADCRVRGGPRDR